MLNLIQDPWIPVRFADGSAGVIAPWQMAEPEVVAPDWPRADFNIACLEMLIGLVFMADPSAHVRDWTARREPDAERLRDRLAAYAPAFNLLGDGPLFLQDFESLPGAPNHVDMLFIDSAGANTAKNNADLMVRRGRYTALDLPLAAMALYTFQAFAPSGGAGNRTSMRGGGPLVTLIEPRDETGPLWNLIWANVPYGQPADPTDLPWMRPTLVSDGADKLRVPPTELFDVEAFFGMPRRLRLVSDKADVTGVVQRPYGTNYNGWKHPLTPYYRQKEGSEWLPKHPRAGHFGFRNWLGIVAEKPGDSLTECAQCLQLWSKRDGTGSVIVAGWSMDNMKPRDFVLSVQPLLELDDDAMDRLAQLVEASDAAASALRGALTAVLAAGSARDTEQERFFQELEAPFLDLVQRLQLGEDVALKWKERMRRQTLMQFDALAMPGLDGRNTEAIRAIVTARKFLGMAFAGYGKQGRALFQALDLPIPSSKKGKAA